MNFDWKWIDFVILLLVWDFWCFGQYDNKCYRPLRLFARRAFQTHNLNWKLKTEDTSDAHTERFNWNDANYALNGKSKERKEFHQVLSVPTPVEKRNLSHKDWAFQRKRAIINKTKENGQIESWIFMKAWRALILNFF